MDYQSIHGQDIASFDLPSTHRLPTVSAADALENLRTDPASFLSTGLSELDVALNPEVADVSRDLTSPGGFQRGQVIEIWGPPGSGKTTFGLQLASDALKKGGKVVWVDGYRPVSGIRLHDILQRPEDAPSPTAESLEPRLANFTHFTCPSLAHLVALLCRPTTSSIPQGASLIVVDSLSALVNQAFPKVQEPRNAPKGVITTSGRRLQVLQSTISSLQKLAATRHLAIVILSHCATRMQAERGATLIPAINSSAWEQGVATRLVLFRDWSFRDDHVSGVRFAGIQKLNGKVFLGGMGPVFAFDVHDKGLTPIAHDASQASVILSAAQYSKRKLDETDFEVADSEEEYGWEDDDSKQLPPNPSQWQGSEDLLVGQHDEDGNRRDEYSDEQSGHDEGSESNQSNTQVLDDINDELG